MNVRDVMTSSPRTCAPSDSLQSVAQVMRAEDTGVVPVVENGKLFGLVTDRDIVVRGVAEGMPPTEPVRRVCSVADIITATPDMSTKDAERLMSEHQVRRLPVVENGRLVGILSLGDLAVKEGKDSRTGDTLESISAGVKKH
jgi:CBS domain-containing protein